MARGLSRLMRDIQRGAARQSASEDRDGRVKEWVHGHHRLLLTPQGGYFVVLLRPPPGAGGRDVPLLFSFKTLYLGGFLHEDGRWHVFSDFDLGPGIDVDNHPAVHSLGYTGRYVGNVFTNVHIAVADLYQSYLTLVDAGHPLGIYTALFRIIVTISEALRFVEWLKELLAIYMEGRENPTVDRFGTRLFSVTFREWNKRSMAVQAGEAAFRVPSYGFFSYDALLRYSGIVSSRPVVGHQLV